MGNNNESLNISSNGNDTVNITLNVSKTRSSLIPFLESDDYSNKGEETFSMNDAYLCKCIAHLKSLPRS